MLVLDMNSLDKHRLKLSDKLCYNDPGKREVLVLDMNSLVNKD